MKFISLKEIMIAINFWSWSSLRKLFDRSGRKIKFSSKIPTLSPKSPPPGIAKQKFCISNTIWLHCWFFEMQSLKNRFITTRWCCTLPPSVMEKLLYSNNICTHSLTSSCTYSVVIWGKIIRIRLRFSRRKIFPSIMLTMVLVQFTTGNLQLFERVFC